MDNPSSFWAHYVSNVASRSCDRLQDAVELALTTADRRQGGGRVRSAHQLVAGCIYLAPYTTDEGESGHYRARVDR